MTADVLPAGWVVEDVTAIGYPVEPCADGSVVGESHAVVWVDRQARARLSVRSSPCPPVEPGDEEVPSMIPRIDVDLGGGITGEMIQLDPSAEPESSVSWSDGSVDWSLDGAGLTTDEVVDAARVAVAEGPLEMEPEGFTEVDRWTTPGRQQHEVGIALTGPSGTRYAARFQPPGHGIGRTQVDPEPDRIPGQDLPVGRVWQPDGGWYAMKVFGAWPGADLDVMVMVTSEPGSAEEQTQADEVDELVGHLRPASTTEWRSFLAGVTHTPVLDEAETYADLADLDVPPQAAPPEDDQPPAAEDDTGSTTTTTTTTLPG